MEVNVLDLFSGIGGFSLGLERAGMRTVAFCEIDPYCRAVLRKRWGDDIVIYDDVRHIHKHGLYADVGPIDLICGGFPCQDISVANVVGKGLAGERSGLWREFARILGDIRPRWAIVENVAALLDRGHGEVLGDLAALGYDAEWHCIPASAIGAPHRRDRVWIVANACGEGREGLKQDNSLLGSKIAAFAEHGDSFAGAWRALDGDFEGLRDGDGLSVAMERRRLHALGNAVVPQIPEIIGKAIMNYECGLNGTHSVAMGKVESTK